MNGNPISYIATGGIIYSWNGTPFAYLESSKVYTFKGKFIAWFENGLFRDIDGNVSGFIKAAMPNKLTELEPLKEIKKLLPLKDITELEPLHPLNQSRWTALNINIRALLADQSESTDVYHRQPDYDSYKFKPFDPNYDQIYKIIDEGNRQYEAELNRQRLLHPGQSFYPEYGWMSDIEFQKLMSDKRSLIIKNSVIISAFIDNLYKRAYPLRQKISGWVKIPVLPYAYDRNIQNVEDIIYYPTWEVKFKKGKLQKIVSNTGSVKNIYKYGNGVDAIGKYFLPLGGFNVYLLVCFYDPTKK